MTTSRTAETRQPQDAGFGGAADRAAFADASASLTNALTIDVEDYFQVHAFAGAVQRQQWETLPGRVEANTGTFLDLLAEGGAHATFFVLGWVAERHPGLIRRIVEDGHELASHGWEHTHVHRQTPEQFRADIRRTKALLEDLGGAPVTGYRAASFSIDESTPWAHEILAEEGHRYSSSIYPIRHDHYGTADAPRFPYRPRGTAGVVEVPITTVRLFGRNFPCGGGGYFRLLPYPASRWLMRRVNGSDRQPCIFYCHPWEFDPRQPRVANVGLKSRFRHYVNIGRMADRLRMLLDEFAWDRMDRVFQSDIERL
jgi:polysaccharide deacetylase family protein (PEP-CTERM system associated)